MSRKSRMQAVQNAQAQEQASKTRRIRLIACIAAVLAIVALIAGVSLLGGEKEAVAPKATSWVEIDVADYGVITAELYGEMAPITVKNFVDLANEGFYDGLTFHRIIDGFMIQGGCPEGTGMGGADEDIKGEFSANGVANPLLHERGVLSMARSQDFNSASSQFFIVHQKSPWLDGQYAAFGRVLTGMEIVDAICQNTPVVDGNGTVLAANQPVINSIRVVDKPAQ